MQIQLSCNAIGLKPKVLPFGITVNSNFWLRLRNAPNTRYHEFMVNREMVTNHESSSVFAAAFETGWRSIDDKKYPWICEPYKLSGKLVQIEVKSTYFGAGQADFELKLIEEDGEYSVLLSQMNVATKGFSIEGMTLRGRLKRVHGPEVNLCTAS